MSTQQLVHLEQQGPVLIIAPLFTFGACTDADLSAEWDTIETWLRDSSVQHVTIDLGAIPYFGSTVLEWMVLIWKRIRVRGGKMTICHCSEMGHQILAAARFNTLWAVYPDRASALAVANLPA